jgi:Putative peptidoglycan binding domain
VLALGQGLKQGGRAQRISEQLSERAIPLAGTGEDCSLENGGTKDKNPTRNLTAVDPATFTEEAHQVTEDQIGLDRGQRRDVQRRLTGLGFDTKVTGKFDDETRSVIRRWQAARGYPASGYLNQLQHKALLSEIVARLQRGDEEPESHASRHRSGGGEDGGRRYYRSSGGGGGFRLFGGMMGGLSGRH